MHLSHCAFGIVLLLAVIVCVRLEAAGNSITVGDGDLAVDVAVRIDVKEDLYQGWNIIYSNSVVENFNEAFSYRHQDNGQAFGNAPAAGAFVGQEAISGFTGTRLVNTKRRNLGTFTGELQSDPFEIRGDKIDFLIGGGKFGLPMSLNLLMGPDRERVREATGNNSSTLTRQSWDVSEFKGQTAVLQIIDFAPVEPFGHSNTVQFAEDRYGFILVDDIRQTDAEGNAVDAAGDKARNFDFETVRTPTYTIAADNVEENGDIRQTTFAIKKTGEVVGELRLALKEHAIDEGLYRLDCDWTYEGESVEQVKIEIAQTLPVGLDACQFHLVPGVLHNGNPIGQAAHYLGEDIPEDAVTVPAGYSVETEEAVWGGWVQPQQSGADPLVSVRLEKNLQEECWQAIHSLPFSAQCGGWFHWDQDDRFTLADGFTLSKSFYLYQAPKRQFQHIPNDRTGYGQVLDAAWKQLYPYAPEKTPHSMTDDYRLKMDTLLDPFALMQEVTVNEKNYHIWYVGRWILGDDFDFQEPYVPMEYFHRYTAFSWSGMLGLTCYNAFKEYLKDGDEALLRRTMDSLDLFAENGVSPSGILYPAFYPAGLKTGTAFCSLAGNNAIDIGHLGEGLYWYIQCYQLLKDKGVADKAQWLDVVQGSLDKIMATFPDGDVPGRFDATTGGPTTRHVAALYLTKTKYTDVWWRHGQGGYPKPSEGGPTGINLLIWPYVAYYQLTQQEQYLDYAKKLGDQLLNVMSRSGIFSGMEVDFFNVDMRMSHAALAACNHLYAATHDPKWLEAAIVTGGSLASWETCYNVCMDGYEETPLGHWDYHSVGALYVDIKAGAPLICYQQAATEFLRLWTFTGEQIWFERARAVLLHGTQYTLTEEKRQWLNANAQGPGDHTIKAFNPKAGFDRHVLGGGTENGFQAWPMKGRWTTKTTGIISMFMLAEGFDWDDIKREFGSLTYDCKRRRCGALDSLDDVNVTHSRDRVSVTARNMVDADQVYVLKIINCPANTVTVDGEVFERSAIDSGIPIAFGPNETKVVEITFP